MKNKKVTQVQLHVGVQVASTVYTSVDVARDGVEMEVTPVGVSVSGKRGEFLIPYSNIIRITLAPSDEK